MTATKIGETHRWLEDMHTQHFQRLTGSPGNGAYEFARSLVSGERALLASLIRNGDTPRGVAETLFDGARCRGALPTR